MSHLGFAPNAIPPHVRKHDPTTLLSSRASSESSSLAEEGEATPLLADQQDVQTNWYEGPLFVTGVKLSVLFVIFTAVVVGTFWFGMPKVEV
jgi:hypothetical protein